ncbi:hypothetical protein, partial [Clostridioides difficile]|uniref:hypothetical protein n=1 Tax=Clostridioides difficile TaxID=1496 RepID=UPI002114F852
LSIPRGGEAERETALVVRRLFPAIRSWSGLRSVLSLGAPNKPLSPLSEPERPYKQEEEGLSDSYPYKKGSLDPSCIPFLI